MKLRIIDLNWNRPRFYLGWACACLLFFVLGTHEAFALAVGDRVQANMNVQVRQTAAGTSLGVQNSGNRGTITGGPQTATFSGISYVWWNVNWDASPDGWCAADFLTQVASTNPAPSISSVAPTSLTASSSNQTLTINGSNFASNATLTFNAPIAGNIPSSAAKLSFISSSKITYEINTGSDTGTWTVKVNNPDGQSSSPTSFTVNAAGSVAPSISSVSPTSLTASSSNQTLTINGSNFSSGATLTFNAPIAGNIPSNSAKLSWISSSKITYEINTGSDTGTWTVKVNNPNGQSSSTASFTVNAAAAAAPSISSVSPTSLSALSTNQTLTINGSNFASTATLSFNSPMAGNIPSNAAKLSFVSSSKITYEINTGSDTGTWTVKVNNPDGQSSSPASFTVNAPAAAAPSISSVSPMSLTASSSNQTLTINGSNFASNATLTFTAPIAGNIPSSAAKLSFVSSSKITYEINTGSDTGTWTVKVNNPDGQSSGSTSFTISAASPSRPNISSVDPNFMMMTGAGRTLTINGSNFVNNAILIFDPPTGSNINSMSAKLNFVSATKITYDFNDGGIVGAWTVVVKNPDGQTSDAAGFAVTAGSVTSGDDYPSELRNVAQDSRDDFWGFRDANRECTSYVAWRMNRDRGTTSAPYDFTNTMNGPNGTSGRWGDAGNWATNARRIGFAVDQTPAVKAIAQWSTVGHVAYVESVSQDGKQITISEYNYHIKTSPGTWGQRTLTNPPASGQSWPDNFIHINDSAVNSAPTIDKITPMSIDALSGNQTIAITGKNFQSGATLTFDPPGGFNLNSNPSKLSFVSSTQIDYAFNSGGDAGTWSVTVNNPGPKSSNAATFAVNSVTVTPILNGVSPPSLHVSTGARTLTVEGEDFSSNATLTFRRPSGNTFSSGVGTVTVVSSARLTYSFNPGTEVGIWTVTVNNADGKSSRAGSFVVLAVGQTLEVSGSIPVKEDFIPVGRANRPNVRMEPRYITIHETDNYDPGANAAMHASYLKGAEAAARPASWHFTVDEKQSYQHLSLTETAWHAGDGETGTGNLKSIGIEICQNIDGNRAQAEENAAWLAARLLNQLGLPLSAVKQHNDWSGKNCPHFIRARTNGWSDFLARVAFYKSNAAVAVGGSTSLSTAAAENGTVAWQRNGMNLSNASGTTLSLTNVQPADVGLYSAVANGDSGTTTDPVVVGIASTAKVVGNGREIGSNLTHPNGNVFDQVLIDGTAEAIIADHGNATRTSFIDLNNDIVQVEFSGAGTLALVLEAASGPATPASYNQAAVSYMKGHATIVITGADETTNVSVFSVGRGTAFDPTGAFNILQSISASNNPANNGSPLFHGRASTTYDGVADLAYIAITSTNGKFGGVRAANARFWSTHGTTGLYAPGVLFTGPVYLGDVNAYDSANAVIRTGSVTDARITGGDLQQPNNGVIGVSGIAELKLTAGSDSGGGIFPAKTIRGALMQNGQDVTDQLVRNAPAADTLPDAFSFADITNADPNSAYTSNSITVAGINAPASISIIGGTYSVNSGSYTGTSGAVNNGDRVTVRLTSSSSAVAKAAAILTIGGISEAYEVTTKSPAPVSYSISISAAANGSVSPSGGQPVVSGGSITFTATPANGFNVNQWLVNGTVAATGQTSYILTNVTANATIQVTFAAQVTSDTGLASGDARTGTLGVGARATWNMTLAAEDSIIVRVGLSGATTFSPQLQIYDPSGNLVRSNSGDTDTMVNFQATVGGTYSIVVSSYYSGESGSYRLNAIKAPGSQTIPANDEGGALTNGGAHEATITLGDIDPWAITAAIGDTLVIRMGRLTGTFSPQIFLYDPAGNLVRTNSGDTDTMISYQAATGGNYTIVSSSYYKGETGTYRLHAVKAPGALTVPTNDEGGLLTNGGAHQGTITNGDLDAWTVTAGIGESLVLRVGRLSGTFSPQLYLIDPTGNMVRTNSGDSDTMITYQATVGGAYTVVASSYYNGETGTYLLHAVKTPGVLVVPLGDEGGTVTPGVPREGSISNGDIDSWTISAGANAQLAIQVDKLGGTFTPQVYLYDLSGNLVRTHSGDSISVSYLTSVGGTYTLVISSYYKGETGTYRIR